VIPARAKSIIFIASPFFKAQVLFSLKSQVLCFLCDVLALKLRK
jgi:hypothetical protein